jgi:hypothetical protein
MQGFDAGGVVLIHAGENGNQWTGVYQYAALHLDFPKPSR